MRVERNRAVSPTTQAGRRTRDLRDGGSTCHGFPPAREGNHSLSPTTTISSSRAVLCCAVPPRRCSPARSSPPPLRLLRFLPPASLLRRLPLLPRAALVYKADALKAAAAAARNFAGRSGENPPDAARTGMKTATTATATTITRILSFTAWSCRATWTFLRNADPALCPAIAQPSR